MLSSLLLGLTARVFLCLVLLQVGLPAHAATTRCEDVLQWAEVHHASTVAVTVTSDRREQYCRFSINGYVADQSAPADFKNAVSTARGHWILALKERKLDKGFPDVLTSFLFAADSKINMELVKNTSVFVEKNGPLIEQCYNEFFQGKEDIKYQINSEAFSLVCRHAGKDQLVTSLIDRKSDLVKATYISR